MEFLKEIGSLENLNLNEIQSKHDQRSDEEDLDKPDSVLNVVLDEIEEEDTEPNEFIADIDNDHLFLKEMDKLNQKAKYACDSASYSTKDIYKTGSLGNIVPNTTENLANFKHMTGNIKMSTVSKPFLIRRNIANYERERFFTDDFNQDSQRTSYFKTNDFSNRNKASARKSTIEEFNRNSLTPSGKVIQFGHNVDNFNQASKLSMPKVESDLKENRKVKFLDKQLNQKPKKQDSKSQSNCRLFTDDAIEDLFEQSNSECGSEEMNENDLRDNFESSEESPSSEKSSTEDNIDDLNLLNNIKMKEPNACNYLNVNPSNSTGNCSNAFLSNVRFNPLQSQYKSKNLSNNALTTSIPTLNSLWSMN